MKRINFLFCLLSLSVLLLTSAKCRKDKNNNPIDKLPPETQTGANTFGCLVNGKVFKPGGASLSGGSLSSNYQFLGTGINGGYYFRLAARYQNNTNGSGQGISINTDSLAIIEGDKLLLTSPRTKQKASARYSNYQTQPAMNYDGYSTTAIVNGELWLKKLDTINQIACGTFWFDAVSDKGDTVKVSDGRFDVRYTR